MTHQEVWEDETYISPNEREWIRYVTLIEQQLQVNLGKCSEKEDGYCMDSAYDAWRASITWMEYVNGKRA
jgi:hypothetical protein